MIPPIPESMKGRRRDELPLIFQTDEERIMSQSSEIIRAYETGVEKMRELVEGLMNLVIIHASSWVNDTYRKKNPELVATNLQNLEQTLFYAQERFVKTQQLIEKFPRVVLTPWHLPKQHVAEVLQKIETCLAVLEKFEDTLPTFRALAEIVRIDGDKETAKRLIEEIKTELYEGGVYRG